MTGKKVFIVDDDIGTTEVETALLEKSGFTVRSSNDASLAVEKIIEWQPDIILLDLVMPKVDGMRLCNTLKQREELKKCAIIILSSKVFEYDKKMALQQGAEGYITKPLTLNKLNSVMDSLTKMDLTFWGTRGTLPVPGKDSLKYGGNTPCISLSMKNRLFVFDAGSGIKCLSDQLMKNGTKRKEAHLFITHPHWDHINAFPFFIPLYIQGNSIKVYGPSQGAKSIETIMSDQMDGVYFPVTVREFGAHVSYEDLSEGPYRIDGIDVQTKLLNHPGNCLGYRVSHQGKSVCYITDNELYFPEMEGYSEDFVNSLMEFITGCDVLIHDTTYFDNEYKTKVNWGHSCVSQVVHLAHDAKVKTLCLFHHDPSQTDADIERKKEQADDILANLGSNTRCLIATEGETLSL